MYMPTAKTKSKAKTKPPAKKTFFPTTRRHNMGLLTQELKKDPMWVSNFVHRPPVRRRSTKNNSLILNRELEKKPPMWVSNYLYRPSYTRKIANKHRPLMKKPLGIKI